MQIDFPSIELNYNLLQNHWSDVRQDLISSLVIKGLFLKPANDTTRRNLHIMPHIFNVMWAHSSCQRQIFIQTGNRICVQFCELFAIPKFHIYTKSRLITTILHAIKYFSSVNFLKYSFVCFRRDLNSDIRYCLFFIRYQNVEVAKFLIWFVCHCKAVYFCVVPKRVMK